MFHEFHFVLKENQKNKIKDIAKKMKMSKSDAVVYIIKIMKTFLERYFYYSIKDDRCEYRQFKAEKHMHVFLDEKSYNILKHITDNMYIFSMAITLRKILEIFIKLVEKIGLSKVIEKLKRIRYLHLRKKIQVKTIVKNKQIRQLSKSLPFFKDFNHYQIGFSKNYTVLSFNFY